MQAVKDNRLILEGKEATDKLLEGAKAIYESVSTTFGPKGRNVLLEKPFGRPVATRDGVTVARDTYFSDRAKNMGAQYLNEASETTNSNAGDGTSATVALAFHIYENCLQAVAAGDDPMEISRQLYSDSYVLLDKLNKLSKPVKKSQLKEVATVSAGDPLLGQLISEAIERVGEDGGILTEKAPIADVEREYVDGYYLQSGFTALQAGKKELANPYVIVSAKRIVSPMDAGEIMTKTAQLTELKQGEAIRFLFIGNFEEAAYQLIVENINKGLIDAVVIKTPPQFGAMATHLLEDIAIYAGCRLIGEGDSVKNFTKGNIGQVNKVVTSHVESTIFASNETETVKDRIQEIKDRIKTEISDAVIERLRDRVAKLEGKVALFKIGGAIDSEKEEKEFRVEDAIQATRAAYKHGIVAGGGVTWLELSKCDVSDIYKKALLSTFGKLLENAYGDKSVIKLDAALNAPTGHGYNLREGDELVDVIKAGIVDPKLVVEEVIKNATSAIATLITIDRLHIFEDAPTT
jgi:chaperonin GroEL